MKFLICMCFLVIIGLSSAENEKRPALKRIVRSTLGQITTAATEQLKTLIIKNCVENGFADNEDDLKQSFSDLEACVSKRKIYVDDKEDFINNIKECSQESIKKVKGCLTEKQSYFPDFLLNLATKNVELLYDDKEIITTDLVPCMKVFQRFDVSFGYLKCIVTTSKRTNDTATIPDSLENYCSRFLPAIHCLTDILDKECTQYPKVKKYSEDHLRANEYPCEQKYE
ncbi:uncharacterized protein LOC114334641 [Diabrotica virgifera virgifera]|uniref:Uncharacterized protein LOC114334641 n=1 Tax=Diabrotica virgifera virgifera TaxID=50390 RepID=A0A6P7FVW2_DIAVI|nr:uncharacterized protein LOC114334641 [Diabrotica virgifera virgifera]